ncbi:MAG: DNA methyltransferase [bacterium]|nr:DNA methyltransferase [bacterium]
MQPAKKHTTHDPNKLLAEDRPAHDWYRFVLSFPPHLVREYLHRFHLNQEHLVLDPFCGTGTTLVELKKQGIRSIGIEASPFAHFASQVKVSWAVNAADLLSHSQQIAREAYALLESEGIIDDPIFHTHNLVQQRHLRRLEPEVEKLLLSGSISPIPLHKTLILRDCLIRYGDTPFAGYQKLAFASALTFSISNLRFGPEVGVGKPKADTSVIAAWLKNIYQIVRDLKSLEYRSHVQATVYHEDARNLPEMIELGSIDAVFTSPPYPNEKDYTRTTRLESVLLGFVKNKGDLQALKRGLLRSNTRGVYKGDDDDTWVENFGEVQQLAARIEQRRIELGKTSGFERLYPKVTKLYFGGMARHFANLRPLLKPGAQLGYVVGDQASYLRVRIRTGEVLATIAQSFGYKVIGIDLFRTRLSTATKEQLREEVLLLSWPG